MPSLMTTALLAEATSARAREQVAALFWGAPRTKMRDARCRATWLVALLLLIARYRAAGDYANAWVGRRRTCEEYR